MYIYNEDNKVVGFVSSIHIIKWETGEIVLQSGVEYPVPLPEDLDIRLSHLIDDMPPSSSDYIWAWHYWQDAVIAWNATRT